MSSRAALPRTTSVSQTMSMTTKWQYQVLPQDNQGPVIGYRVAIRIDDPPRARLPQRPVAEKAIQLTQHHLRSHLMHASIQLTRRKIATIVTRPASKPLSAPQTHCKWPTRHTGSGIGWPENSHQARVAQASQMQRAGFLRNHGIAGIRGVNNLRKRQRTNTVCNHYLLKVRLDPRIFRSTQ